MCFFLFVSGKYCSHPRLPRSDADSGKYMWYIDSNRNDSICTTEQMLVWRHTRIAKANVLHKIRTEQWEISYYCMVFLNTLKVKAWYENGKASLRYGTNFLRTDFRRSILEKTGSEIKFFNKCFFRILVILSSKNYDKLYLNFFQNLPYINDETLL